MVAVSTTQTGVFVWEASDHGRPFILPSRQDGGLEIRSMLSANITAAAPIAISMEWIEI